MNIEPGTLYIVATPIGNLDDLTARAREVLSGVEVVLCEDTRVTANLLTSIGSSAKTQTVHQHTEAFKLGPIVAKLNAGQSMAFVSDAGTPNVSDPGGKLVQMAVEAGVKVVPIPGVSAVATLLSVCGFPADHFTFLGFPPHKKGRNTYFEMIAGIEHTVVLYESKHRIEKTLAQLPPDRLLCVGREMTKMFEAFYRGTPAQVLEAIAASSSKGEFAIAIAPSNWK